MKQKSLLRIQVRIWRGIGARREYGIEARKARIQTPCGLAVAAKVGCDRRNPPFGRETALGRALSSPSSSFTTGKSAQLTFIRCEANERYPSFRSVSASRLNVSKGLKVVVEQVFGERPACGPK
jgi:hypothetical protein